MLKKSLLVATAMSALVWGGTASAATLISAAVTGGPPLAPTGTVWDTNNANTFYALFIAPNNGFGTPSPVVNPNDEAIAIATNPGVNGFLTAGDGWPTPSPQGGPAPNSDLIYTLTLGFAGGGSLVGTFTPGANLFTNVSGPLVIGNETLALTEFSWTRNLSNPVRQFQNTPGGDPNDYLGGFTYSSRVSQGVPEPATWAMLLIGFGGIGFSMRRRKSDSRTQRVRIAYS